MKPTVTRIVGYVRVSTEEQVDGHSLDAQRREIERYAERQGFVLVNIYADEGVSAHTDRIEKRPQLAALLADASRGSFDTVVVHTIDRWARNMRVQLETLSRLGSAEVGFVSLMENFDFSTPHGKFNLNMIGGVNQFFSDQLALHVLKSQRHKAEGGLPIGPVPFGYVIGTSGEVAIVEPSEGEAIRQAFAARAAGRSNGQIAEVLNGDGFRTRKGNFFTAHAMKDMFNCRFYTGAVLFQGELFPGRHEALIADELFDRVQARRTHRGPHRRTSDRPRGVLAGIIKCARCGNSLHAERGRNSSAMYRERHGRDCETNRRSFMAHTVDEQIGQIIRSLELPTDWRTRIAGYARETNGPSVKSLKERKRRLVRGYVDDGFSLAEYEMRLVAIESEIRSISTSTSAPVEVEEVAALLSDLPSMWAEATADERGRLLAPIVEHVLVDVESKRLSSLVPMSGFRTLLDIGIQKTADCSAVILAPSVIPQARGVLELVETGENRTPRPEYVRQRFTTGVAYGV